MEKIKTRNPQEMYRRAKNTALNQGKDIQFYQFWEWIQKDLTKSIYTSDDAKASGLKSSGLKDFGLNNQPFRPRAGLGPSHNMSLLSQHKLNSMLGQGLKLNNV